MEAIPSGNNLIQRPGSILHPRHHAANIVDLTAIRSMGTGEDVIVVPQFLDQPFENRIFCRIVDMTAQHKVFLVVGSLVERHRIMR